MPQLSDEAQNLNWLVANFARVTPGVAHAIVVAADGLPVAVSDRLDRSKAGQLAAITSGLASLTHGAAQHLGAGAVKHTIVQMEQGLLFVMSISDGSCLVVLAVRSAKANVIAYEMAVLVARVGGALTPALRAELHAALQS
jgi:predicted regulator of Ras-like GTPase activity (Roadblock/LC7/MglB family)